MATLGERLKAIKDAKVQKERDNSAACLERIQYLCENTLTQEVFFDEETFKFVWEDYRAIEESTT